MVDHFCVKFGDPIAASVFEILCEKTNRQTDIQTNVTENHTPATTVGAGMGYVTVSGYDLCLTGTVELLEILSFELALTCSSCFY